jgi:hypothetical protein
MRRRTVGGGWRLAAGGWRLAAGGWRVVRDSIAPTTASVAANSRNPLRMSASHACARPEPPDGRADLAGRVRSVST